MADWRNNGKKRRRAIGLFVLLIAIIVVTAILT
jgi:hypothetical protein